jgi:carboxyl-terminal processing protease
VASEPVTKDVKERVLEKMNKIITTYAYVPGVDFSKWPQMIGAEKDALDKADTQEAFQDAVNKALSTFGLTHISMQTPDQSKARLEGATVGLGVSIHRQEDGLLVIRVVPKSAAEEAKLKPGDLLTEADGKPVHDPIDLQGKEGQAVVLTVKGPDSKVRTVKVTRRKFSTIRPEQLEWVGKDTAIIHVYTFDLSYDADRVESLMKQAAKAKNLIVDLRDNPGGVVMNVQHFLGLLLPPSTPIGTFINKRLVDRYIKEEHGNPDDLKAIGAWSDSKVRSSMSDLPVYKGHVAVAVNGFSGSGAEIAAAALKENLAAPVIGTKSAGAVLVALMVPLPEGYTLLYPITDYVTGKGLRLEGNGVTPDVVAEDPKIPLPGTKDEVIDKAVASLSQGAKKVGAN